MFEFLNKKNKISENIEKKAVDVAWSGAIGSILNNTPSTNYFPQDSSSILNYIKGYGSACITKISTQISALPYYFYRIEKSSNSKYIGKSLKVNDLDFYKKVNKSFVKGDYTLSKIFEHPFVELFENKMSVSTSEFFYILSAYLLSIGNAYIEIVKDDRGNILDLKPLFSEYMSIKNDKDGNITEYKYQPLILNLNSKTYLPEEIIHLKRLTAGNIIAGRGVLEDCLIDIGMGEESKKFMQSLLVNHMAPTSIIAVKNSIKSEAERIKNKFVEQFSGYNRGKSAVVFGDISVTGTPANLQQTQVVELNEFVKKSICAIFQVPIDLLDTSNSNKASSIVAINNFLRFTVFPMANTICDQITKQLISKEYDSSFILQYDTAESLENDPQDQADLMKKYLDMGVLTKEEIKTKLGL